MKTLLLYTICFLMVTTSLAQQGIMNLEERNPEQWETAVKTISQTASAKFPKNRNPIYFYHNFLSASLKIATTVPEYEFSYMRRLYERNSIRASVLFRGGYTPEVYILASWTKRNINRNVVTLEYVRDLAYLGYHDRKSLYASAFVRYMNIGILVDGYSNSLNWDTKATGQYISTGMLMGLRGKESQNWFLDFGVGLAYVSPLSSSIQYRQRNKDTWQDDPPHPSAVAPTGYIWE